MKSDSCVTVRWTVLVAAAVALLAVGAGAAYVGVRAMNIGRPADARMKDSAPSAARPAEPSASAGAAAEAPSDGVVTLGPEAIERAGITVASVTAGAAADGLHAPGIVEPDAYRQVAVTPLVGGRVARVMAELGQHVRPGQTLARIFSPELAEARTRYVSVRAELLAHERELERTEKLVQLGAASRQELERIHAAHTARRADLESASARLQLLGVPAASLEHASEDRAADAIVDVPAPIAGVVTARSANVGMNVDETATIFTVVDLSSVWVVVDLYEQDFSRVRVGTTATITTPAYPDLTLRGKVGYIHPQLAADTRTAKVRIEVPNARNELRLGMFAEVRFADESAPSAPMIPRSAVQTIGDRTVVYLADPGRPGTFVERDVRLGPRAGDQVAVVAGVRIGNLIVAAGAFHVRAELERLRR